MIMFMLEYFRRFRSSSSYFESSEDTDHYYMLRLQLVYEGDVIVEVKSIY